MDQENSNHNIPYQTVDQIRTSYIEFFQKKAHKFIPSANIVPWDDPSLLFTNAGMNQFKAIFLGHNRENLRRAVNSQKCLRVSGKHNDLDEVGKDGTHHTFFEMLGNWSFGDYYKKEAISWAWELLTEVWKIPKNRLFATVYTTDDEAEQLWKTCTDIDPAHIMRFESDNFWEMGETGPCGPCSEIHFDWGDLRTQQATYQDPEKGVNGTDGRYVEIWNLVFMQSERLKSRELKPLKNKHVDTGSGLERICAIIQGKSSNYETDVFQPIINKIAELSGQEYQKDEKGMPHRVIADHLRALAVTIADGATPGNEGRAYVLRRILRRACRYAYKLKQKEAFLYKLVPTVCSNLSKAFPELASRQAYIEQVIYSEENRFLTTLVQGMQKLEKLIDSLLAQGKKEISGKDVFIFHDTFGFPIDLTRIIAEEKKMNIDHQGFEQYMQEQKERARKSAKFDTSLSADEGWIILNAKVETQFVGYTQLEATTQTLRFQEQGDNIYVILEKTPFYAESGGQVGDQGWLKNQDVELAVVDTFKILNLWIHKCNLEKGLINAETMKKLSASVDQKFRKKATQNHSATHLLHAALKQCLGQTCVQQGSYVGPDRLRFDFSFSRAVSKEEIVNIEAMVNNVIQENIPVKTEIMQLAEAKEQGALALFGEQYENDVRVLTMGSFSKELCGGTHVNATGDIGILTIKSESSVAAGIRRIEAWTGMTAINSIHSQDNILDSLASTLKVPINKLNDKSIELMKRVKQLEGEVTQFRLRELEDRIKKLIANNMVAYGDHYVVITAIEPGHFPKENLQKLLDCLVAQLENGIAVLTHTDNEQLSILAAVGKKAVPTIKANELIKEISPYAGAKGGGRPDRARAGSKQPHKAEEVLFQANNLLKKQLSKENTL